MLGKTDRARDLDKAATLQTATEKDTELAQAARGDPQAFEQLYLRHADHIYRYTLCRVDSVSQAEEIVADTMLEAFEQLERFDPARGSFATWLLSITRHRIADERRGLSRLRRALSRLWADSGSDEDALSVVLRTEQVARLRTALGRMPAKDCDVLLLRYIAELSSPEVGEMLNLSAGAVRVRIHRALLRLAVELGEHDDAK